MSEVAIVDTYQQWNAAIISTVIRGFLPDEPVFLTIDAERLSEIAVCCGLGDGPSARDQFVAAVRERCVVDGRISVRTIEGVDTAGRPLGVGFLTLLVLAAGERGAAGDDRFYLSLSNLLWPQRPQPAQNRQDLRMPPGERCEEPLWKVWNSWLLTQGYAPTARRGQGPRDKFRMYPISQVTLSRSEQAYLIGDVLGPAIKARQLSASLDQGAFDFWLRQRAKRAPHLWQGITDRVLGRDRVGGHRFPVAFRETFIAECFEAYALAATGSDASASATSIEMRAVRSTVAAGLIREAALDGTVEYRLRPARPRRTRNYSGGRVVIHDRLWDLLASEDPQWFQPIGEPLPSLASASYVVENYPGVVSLDLPDRPFWVLAPDPNAPTDQLLVSDRQPDPHERVMVVVRLDSQRSDAVIASLHRLKYLGFFDWEGTADAMPDWREFRRCRILLSPWPSEAPAGVDPELYLRLSPEASDTIRFELGLRAADERGAFMEGCLPAVSIVTEADPLILRVAPLDSLASQDTQELKGRRGQLFHLPSELSPGLYVLEGLSGVPGDEQELCQRRLVVRAWKDLSIEAPSPGLWTSIAGGPEALRVCGPRCEKAPPSTEGEFSQ
jgi:hypothetical protein